MYEEKTGIDTTVSDADLKREMRALILSMQEGQSLKTGAFINSFCKFMESKGWVIRKRDKLYYLFYTVRSALEKEGLLKQIEKNVFYISCECEEEDSDEDDEVEESIEDDTFDEDTQVLGNGAEQVYAIYYDAYRELAGLKGVPNYPCKIGRTGDINKRLSKTFEPEKKHIGAVFNTDNAKELENLFHLILKVKGRHVADAPGQEWFETNIDEVCAIYKTLISSVGITEYVGEIA